MFFNRKRECQHNWEITEASNVLQVDDMGYPLRLCISKCIKCGKTDQVWIDVSTYALDELKTGESVLLEWRRVK